MANKTFKFEGGRELDAALAKLPTATAKNVGRRVLKARAKPIRDDAEANAPSFTGRLQDDVKIGTRLTRRQSAMNRRLGPEEVEVHVGVSDPAGLQTEYGNEHQPAEPWFRPAWDSNVSGALRGIGEDMWTEISKSAKRLARKAARMGS